MRRFTLLLVTTAALLAFASAASAATVTFSAPAADSMQTSLPHALFNADVPPSNTNCKFERLGPAPATYFDANCGSGGSQMPGSSNGFQDYDWDLSAAFGPVLPDGNYRITADFTFGAANQIATRDFSYDGHDPVITINSGPSAVTPANDNTPNFAFAVTDSNLASFGCALVSGTPATPPTVPDNTCIGLPVSAHFDASTLADGTYTFYVKATDTYGRIGYGTRSFVVDTTPPAITIGGLVAGQKVETAFPAVTISAVGASSALCNYDSNAPVSCTDPSFGLAALADGAHALHVSATDAAGNTATVAIAFTIDTSLGAPETAPLPTLPTPSTVTFSRPGSKVKGSKLKLGVAAKFAVPAGRIPATVCRGSAKLSVSGKLKGKKTKTFTKTVSLKASGKSCVSTAALSIPKAYKGKSLKTKLVFGGNSSIGAFAISGKIKKA